MQLPIAEIFSSLQGEGLYLGQRHLFVRVAGCDLACSYCDEREKKGSQTLSEKEILDKIYDLDQRNGPHAFVSLTGGEPLNYAAELRGLCLRLRKDFKIYLETNGVMDEALRDLVEFIDVIAMDIKLKSVGGEENQFEKNKAFLNLAEQNNKSVFVKIVVGERTDENEFKSAVAIVSKVNNCIPLVLQPLTTAGTPVRNETLLRLHAIAARWLDDVRVVPRLQVMLNIP
jgi:7-carboxy-7-deazaguanine synthase